MIACFAGGVGYGVWAAKKERMVMRATPLRVLCGDDWISDRLLKQFSEIEQVPIQLITYDKPSELLQQVANADGKIDVICTSSLLLKSLIQNQWVQKAEFEKATNVNVLSVDFLHLQFDPKNEYSLPLFWNLYGLFAKQDSSTESLVQIWQSKKLLLWGDQLPLISLLNRSGIHIEESLENTDAKGLRNQVLQAANNNTKVLKPGAKTRLTPPEMLQRSERVFLPLGQVAKFLNEDSGYKFSLPKDGGILEVGLLAIGSKSDRPELALRLINDIISTAHALQIHKRMAVGVVHTSLEQVGLVAPLQTASALRQFPLNRLVFPDVSLEVLPRFQKVFDETFVWMD
jgi:spermidine/putrescine transport system substrate-binding protein